jgi:hypothetical protein
MLGDGQRSEIHPIWDRSISAQIFENAQSLNNQR